MLLLDTSFIVSVLGLHNPAANKICSQVVEISRNLGFSYVIFDQTIEEVRHLLIETAEKLKVLDNISDVFENDITQSCFLNASISPTDLERIASDLENEIMQKIEYDLKKIDLYKGKALQHSMYNHLIEKIKKDKYSALHDTVAFLYVRKIRGNDIKRISEANCWFVQDRKSSRNRIKKDNGFINETVSSHDLLVLLCY